ncbi:MAG: hypothetical protein F6K40_12410 [Okeania sp. SIO3I5]|uniref:hypothetical protein n=1 Tax=Okeania sp. SIO3I5 TaxID=2607805 RepID=UPI0013BA030C|nr:hypothetical protein [Okeania sp. SIO3I5]NEQ37032.1 hypothetical protein [Okeania sp. SIO3I5]
MQKFQLSSGLTNITAILTCEKNTCYSSRQRWVLSFENEDIEYTSSNSLIARDYARKIFREKVFPQSSRWDGLEGEFDLTEIHSNSSDR